MVDIYSAPKNLVLVASAGTGKTHALVGVVIHRLLADDESGEPGDPSRIVATTFSRKAAAEIRARVTAALERLAEAPETSPYVGTLRVGFGAEPTSDRVDRTLRARAGRALGNVGAARFGTLHSFATSIVRAYAMELGLAPSFDLVSEADARARADDAIAAALERRLASDPVAVRSLAEAAGSIDRLVAQMRRALGTLEEDGRPARELMLPTADAAAIEHQVREFVQHARDLRKVPKWDEAAERVLDAWDATQEGTRDLELLERTFAALSGIAARGKKTPEVEAFAAFREELAGAQNEEKGRRLARTFAVRERFRAHALVARDVLAEAEGTIERASRAGAALGFGELLRAARELLRERPDIATEVSRGIDALLVDEVQDTSRVQRDLVALLWAKPNAREAGRVPSLGAVRPRGLLIVGDRKQSIYGFRGADVSVFAELAVGLAGAPARHALGIPAGVTWEPKEPVADLHALRENRRSVAPILAFANAFSAARFQPGAPPPQLFEIAYVPGTEDLLVPGESSSSEVEGPRVTWLRVAPVQSHTSTRLEDALVLAERVRAILETKTPKVGRERRDPSYRDIAVLASTNGMLDAAAFALAQHDIPHVVAGKGFFRTREVRDLVAMLSLVLDPTDRLAMLAVLRGPWAGVHDETLLGLTHAGSGLVPPWAWEAPPHPALVHDEDRASLRAVSALVVQLASAATRLGPGPILREAVRALALESVWAALPRGAQRIANANKLLALADAHPDARDFLTMVDEAAEQELAESEAATFSDEDDAVRLLTVHASKGLDFPIVIVPELGAPPPRGEKGALRIVTGSGTDPSRLVVRVTADAGTLLEPPSFRAAQELARRRERAERQRLAYVAVTRAADAMLLVGGRKRMGSKDAGAATLDALESLTNTFGNEGILQVEDVSVPAVGRPADAPPVLAAAAGAAAAAPRVVPRWRSLPIAPTALADFAHCPRRFELVHVLGLPERVAGQRAHVAASPTATAHLDARTQGTLAHAVLERVPPSAFGARAAGADTETSRALAAEGVAPDHPDHAAILERVDRFLDGPYARAIAERGAHIERELAFVLPVRSPTGEDDGEHTLVLRGSMDLVVAWPDGSVDVVDYKSARGGNPDAYAFQLDVYALALREAFPSATRLRAGLVFLGSARAGEPTWRELGDDAEVRARLSRHAAALVDARLGDRFPRVELARCEAIYCGFIGRCHPNAPDSDARG